MRRPFLLILALLAMLTALPLGAAAQNGANERYFPETKQTVRGRFLEYWDGNGALVVFGYPLSQSYNTFNSSGNYVLTQYFERQRFELHPSNQRPYDVLLGRLGAEVLEAKGVALPGRANPISGCRYFTETGHNVCNQGGGLGFLQYWQTHGLDFGDLGLSERESLALFGYPITEATMETNSSGDRVLTQWFERARLEWHPNNDPQFRVLQGRLGAELLDLKGQPSLTSTVNVVMLDSNGGPIGCGDTAVMVQRSITPTTAPLHAAMSEMLLIKDQFYGQSGLYNALWQSSLSVDTITLTSGHAVIYLKGTLRLSGVCDNPRVEAQLQRTALQFNTVKSVEIYINGKPLKDVLSQR